MSRPVQISHRTYLPKQQLPVLQNLPQDENYPVFDNLLELVWPGNIRGVLLWGAQLRGQNALAGLPQLVVGGHTEEGGVKQAILLSVLVILTLDQSGGKGGRQSGVIADLLEPTLGSHDEVSSWPLIPLSKVLPPPPRESKVGLVPSCSRLCWRTALMWLRIP